MSVKRILILAANAAVIGTAEALIRASKVGSVEVVDSNTAQTDQARETIRIFESQPMAPITPLHFARARVRRRRSVPLLHFGPGAGSNTTYKFNHKE